MFKVIGSNKPEIEIWQSFDPYVEKNHLKTLSGCPIIALVDSFTEIGVAEWRCQNLTGSSEIAVSAHAQCKFGR